jgi:hypothetical protein
MPTLWVCPATHSPFVMFTDEIIGVITRAIKSEDPHPLGAMRHLPASEEDVALTVLNALDEAGFDVVGRTKQPSP